MNAERAPAGAFGDLGQEVEHQSTEGRGRAAFDETRYPPVAVAALQRLPGSSARSFAIGIALGQWIDSNGSARRMPGKDAVGSLIKPERLPDVLEAIGIVPRTWREYVKEWEENYLAHKCGRATVCLFTRPLPDRCPSASCRDWIDYDHAEKPAHLARGPGFASGAISAGRAASSAPLRGTNSAVRDDANGTNGAVPEHDPATPGSQGFNGKEVGSPGADASVEAVDLPEVVTQEGISESAALRSIDPWPSHFEDKSCPECGCWPHQGDHFAGCSHRTTIRDVSA